MADDPDQCIECKVDFYMHNYMCVSECPEHYFADDIHQSCRLCHPACATCNGFHVHDCVTCDSQYALQPTSAKKNTCETHCRDEYYEQDSVDGKGRQVRTCLQCHESCYTCDGPHDIDCITCHASNFLQGEYLVKWLFWGDYFFPSVYLFVFFLFVCLSVCPLSLILCILISV